MTFSHAAGPEASPEQLEDARFTWTLVKHVKSNAITVAKQGRLLGMGSGQPNRVKSTQIALEKAGSEAQVRRAWQPRCAQEPDPFHARPSDLLGLQGASCAGKLMLLQVVGVGAATRPPSQRWVCCTGGGAGLGRLLPLLLE